MTQTDPRFHANGASGQTGTPRPPSGPAFVYDPWTGADEAATGPQGAHAAPTTPDAPAYTGAAFGPGATTTTLPTTGHADPYAPLPGHGGPGGAGPGGPGTDHGRDGRRPGWFALGATSIGAAVLASMLTAGVMAANQNDNPTAVASSATSGTVQQQSGPVTSSSAENPDWEAVAAAVSQSVVAIQVSTTQGGAQGSGVVLDTDGHVVTNNHVVSGAQQIMVVFADGRGYSASVVGTDPATDLAVVKIDNPPSGLTPITVGDSDAVKVGDPVMAVGNPLGLSNTVTTGIVSAVDRPVTTASEDSQQQNPFGGSAQTTDPVVTNAIQTDAAVNPGNSGGALVDVQGRLIGINSSIASLGTSTGSQAGSIGIGFAIPSDLVKNIADDLISTGTASHAWLGVSLGDQGVQVDGATYQAAVIGQVVGDSPAAKADLKAGDAIIAIDGEAVNGAESLTAQIRERKPGTEAALTVVRDGKKIEVTVTLGTRSED